MLVLQLHTLQLRGMGWREEDFWVRRCWWGLGAGLPGRR